MKIIIQNNFNLIDLIYKCIGRILAQKYLELLR